MKYKPEVNKINPDTTPKAQNNKLNMQSLSQEQINELLSQGITLEQLVEIATEQGQPIPPLILTMIEQQGVGLPISPSPNGQPQQAEKKFNKTKQFPTMMNVKQYKEYSNIAKKEKKDTQKQKPNVYGYIFSPLISEEMKQDIKRTQGSFFVGVNIANLINSFRDMIVDSEKKAYKSKTKKLLKSNPDSIFNKIGEWVDVDFETILDKKMGMRGSDVPLLPEKRLTEFSTFYEILSESKKYSDRGFYGKITPLSLLTMTRMLYKYRQNNAQWYRVSTVLDLIYKYLGTNMTRDQYFKTTNEIPIRALMDLEEFYNTNHIFMSEEEIIKFKSNLDFYKYDKNLDIKKQLQKLKNKMPPPITTYLNELVKSDKI